MAVGAKILSELSNDAVRWVQSLANKLSGTPENVAYETGEKLVNLDRFAPQMFDIYDDRALYYALQEAQEGSADVGLINPDTFRRAAAEIPMTDPFIRAEVAQKVSDLRDLRSAGIRYSDVPYLAYDDPYPGIAQVTAHQGRHRSRALGAEGEPYQLVRFIPKGAYDPQYGDGLLSQMDPDTQLFSEVSTMSGDSAGENVGTLGDLIKFLSVAGVAAPGALSVIGDGDAPQVP